MDKDEKHERQKEVSRAQEAERLAAHPMMVEAFKAVRARLHDGIEQTARNDREERERLYMALFAFRQIEQHFIDIMETGDMAAHQLQAIARGKEPRKPLLRKIIS